MTEHVHRLRHKLGPSYLVTVPRRRLPARTVTALDSRPDSRPDPGADSGRAPQRAHEADPHLEHSDRFIMLREDADPDVLWNIEVFRSAEAKDAYETSDLAEELREEIIDLLAEPPLRIEAHPYSAIPVLPGDSD